MDGISLTSISDGPSIAEQELVITRGSPSDNQLNMSSVVNISYPAEGFQIDCSNGAIGGGASPECRS